MTDWTLADDVESSSDDGIDRTADSPIVQILPGEVIYRASSVGGCPRKLWAARSNNPVKPTTAKMQAIFDRGKELEPIILAALEAKGWELRNYQGEVLFQVFTLPSGTVISIIGHYDCEARYPIPSDRRDSAGGALSDWSEWLPCDVKGFGPALITEYLSHGLDNLPHYQWQQSIYVIGHDTAKSFLMPIWDKDKSELLQASLYPRIPDITFSDIEKKLMQIEQAFVNSIMPDCTNDFPCPFYYLHDENNRPDDPLPEAAHPFIRARQIADAKIKLYQQAKDTMTDQIMLILRPEGYAGPVDFKTVWEGNKISIQPNSGRFNTAHAKRLLQEAGFDIESSDFNTPGVGFKLVIESPK